MLLRLMMFHRCMKGFWGNHFIFCSHFKKVTFQNRAVENNFFIIDNLFSWWGYGFLFLNERVFGMV